jgi:hypothetical protein
VPRVAQKPQVEQPGAHADPVEVFRARCEARAALYAAGEFDLHEAVDVLQQEFAERLGLIQTIGQDAVQAIMAAAFEPVRAAENRDNVTVNFKAADDDRNDGDHGDDNHDDFDGISSTFAAACKEADAEAGPRPKPEPIPIVAIHGVPSAAALQAEYEASIRRTAERYGPPKATLDAAEYLIGAKRPLSELRAFLNGRSAHEIEAIQQHIGRKRRKAGTS